MPTVRADGSTWSFAMTTGGTLARRPAGVSRRESKTALAVIALTQAMRIGRLQRFRLRLPGLGGPVTIELLHSFS